MRGVRVRIAVCGAGLVLGLSALVGARADPTFSFAGDWWGGRSPRGGRVGDAGGRVVVLGTPAREPDRCVAHRRRCHLVRGRVGQPGGRVGVDVHRGARPRRHHTAACRLDGARLPQRPADIGGRAGDGRRRVRRRSVAPRAGACLGVRSRPRRMPVVREQPARRDR